MSRVQLEKKTQELKNLFDSLVSPEGLKDKVIFAYTKKALNDLSAILTFTPDVQSEYDLCLALREYLDLTWDKNKGTILAYTSIPDAEICNLLYDIAEHVAAHLNASGNPMSPLQVLMPSLNIESPGFGGYPPLGYYQKVGFVTDEEGRVMSKIIYVKPDDNFNLRNIIRTHILGDNYNCLVPLNLALNDDFGLETTSPYKLVDDTYASPYISKSELERILAHSGLTIAIKEARERYHIACSGSVDLYSQLEQLAKSLNFSGSHSGIGTDARAADGEASARIAFAGYYETLSDVEKEKIPHNVKQRIEKILTAHGDCAGLLSESLRLIKEHEETLRKIGQNNESKSKIIQTAKSELEFAKSSLQKAIEWAAININYCGEDKLALPSKLIRDLNIEVNISTIKDIEMLTALPVSDIKDFCKNEKIQQNIIDVIGNIVDLINFSISTHEDKLVAIFESIALPLSKKLATIEKTHLSAWFNILPLVRLEKILETLKDKMVNILKSSNDYRMMLNGLNAEQCTAVCTALKDNIGDIVKSSRDFVHALKYLNSEQRTAVFVALKDRISDIVKSSDDFRLLLVFLNHEQRNIVCAALKDKMDDIVKSGYDFGKVLRHLNPEQRTAIYELLKDKFGNIDIVKSGRIFGDVLGYLNPEQRSAVYAEFKDKLVIL